MLDHEPYIENSSDTLLTKNDNVIGSNDQFLKNDDIITIKNSQKNQVLTVAQVQLDTVIDGPMEINKNVQKGRKRKWINFQQKELEERIDRIDKNNNQNEQKKRKGFSKNFLCSHCGASFIQNRGK